MKSPVRGWLRWVRGGLGCGYGLGRLRLRGEQGGGEESARQEGLHDGPTMEPVSLRSEVAMADGIVHRNRLPGPMGTLRRFAELPPYVLD